MSSARVYIRHLFTYPYIIVHDIVLEEFVLRIIIYQPRGSLFETIVPIFCMFQLIHPFVIRGWTFSLDLEQTGLSYIGWRALPTLILIHVSLQPSRSNTRVVEGAGTLRTKCVTWRLSKIKLKLVLLLSKRFLSFQRRDFAEVLKNWAIIKKDMFEYKTT